MNNTAGKVYLIGAGPGDPGLLTLKARSCIQKADVVVYDYLASPSLLSHAGQNAQIIYVGKKGGDHTLTQEKINLLLVEKAKQGLSVARLKGGDPFIFGRGGEEAQMLLSHGIAFEIIPGVTSAVAAPAYAGIPITHRDHASSVCFITGHEDPAKEDSAIQWDLFAKNRSTLVFLMGVKNLEKIVTRLMENGKPADTPAALVQWGTTARQQTVTGQLDNIVEAVRKAKLLSPAVIVVGPVVKLRSELQWFDTSKLFGKRIVVTRARAQASDLVEKLSELGAHCIEIPTIKIVPPKDNKALKTAVNKIDTYDWLVFTSVNGVKFFFDTLFEMEKDVRILGHLKFGCIGPVTKQRLSDYGIISDILPETYRAESVIDAFSSMDMTNQKVLVPRALKARSILPEELVRLGAVVDDIAAYETILDDSRKNDLVEMLENGQIDGVTFTSSSTVTNFMTLLQGKNTDKLLKQVCIASIGPITSDTIRNAGLHVDIEARDFTIPGLVTAISGYFES